LYVGNFDQGANGFFEWSPDGKGIVFSRNGELQSMNIATGNYLPYPWKNTDAIGFNDISPDGNQTVYIKQRMNAKLILIDNFH
jgi:Tol biopolymer transport system component